MAKVFGIDKKYGTLSPCRAKPENRGKGNCPHADHVEREGPAATPQAIERENEKILHEHFSERILGEKRGQQQVESPGGGEALTRQEFAEATQATADAFPQGDWEVIQDFYKKYRSRIADAKLHETYDHASENIAAFLESDDPVAKRTRAFLGPEIDVKEFSHIIASNTRAMRVEEWTNSRRCPPMRRIVLSQIMNDMNRERYIATVMYFGGRCCYCQRPLTKGAGGHQVDTQASGEHITPVSPDDKSAAPGATRYGNMALACVGCNRSRANSNLEEWMRDTDQVPQERKVSSLKRIADFRRYALYRDFNTQEKEVIDLTIQRLQDEQGSFKRNKDGSLKQEDAKAMRSSVAERVNDLRSVLIMN